MLPASLPPATPRLSCQGMFFSFASARILSNSAGLTIWDLSIKLMDGPLCSEQISSCALAPVVSLAVVPSSASAQSGCTRKAAAFAPRRPISS